MKKYISIYLYGALIILVGIFLIFSDFDTFNLIRLILGITMTIGSIIAFVAAYSREKKQVQIVYHEMHALAIFVYGISILTFSDTLEKLEYFTIFLLFFYVFSEIIFCNWIFNLGKKVVYKILFIRLILALAIGIGTIVAMNIPDSTLNIFGILFVFIGINVILYVPIMKQNAFNQVADEVS